MKKITAFIGTGRKKATYLAVQEFEKNLQQYGKIDFEYVFLNEYKLNFCMGCKLCFNNGEEFCPSKDDRDVLIKKIQDSDGIIFATPTYDFQVTALMKNFLDRLGFTLHRPRFFDKAFIAIVTQGLPLGSGTLKYLTFVGKCIGFNTTKGCCVTTLEPITDSQMKKLKVKTKKAADRFYKELTCPLPSPSFMWLAAFRLSRSGMATREHECKDYQYYKEKGWFTSDYYYPTNLGPIKKIAGSVFDLIGSKVVKW